MSLKGSDGSIWRLLAHLSKPVFKYCFLNLGSHRIITQHEPANGMPDQLECLFSEVCSDANERKQTERGGEDVVCVFFLDSLCPRARF